MSTPGAVEAESGFHPGSRGASTSDAPVATWKLGLLVLSGLPEGPAAWIVRSPGGQALLRGWFGSESGRAAIQLPFDRNRMLLEIRSGASRWTVEVPPRRS